MLVRQRRVLLRKRDTRCMLKCGSVNLLIIHFQRSITLGLSIYPWTLYSSANAAIGHLYLNDPLIPPVYNTYYLNQIVDVAAWGQTTQAATTTSGTLKFTTMKIIDTTACRTAFAGTSTNEICIVSGSTSQTQWVHIILHTCKRGQNLLRKNQLSLFYFLCGITYCCITW
jgi:hypothetical protein